MKTIPYMGSKRKLLPFLKDSMLDYLGDTEIHSFFDAFAGSGRVSHHFRNMSLFLFQNRSQSASKIYVTAVSVELRTERPTDCTITFAV